MLFHFVQYLKYSVVPQVVIYLLLKSFPEAVGNPIESMRYSLTTFSRSFSAVSLLYPRTSFAVFHILHNEIALFDFVMSVLYKLLRNHHS